MIPLVKSGNIEYGLVERPDLKEMANLLADVFSRFEPPAVAAGLSFDDMYEIVRLFGQRAPDDALTVLARDQISGKIVGAMLTDDFASAPPAQIEQLLMGHFSPIAALLEELDDQYRRIHRIDPGKVLHLFMLAVAPEFGGKGIARTLVRVTLNNGRRNGYDRAVTEATGNVSQHIFRSLGFVDRFRILYKEFDHGGRRPFESITEHQSVVLLERHLRS